MTFTHPTYLWGLFSLLLPIIIHLLNQGDVITLKVGSIKYLSEHDTKQSRKIKINEILLLILRLLLLVLVVLVMAGPKWKTPSNNTSITYLIEPSLLQNAQIKSLLDSLPSSDLKLLADGFPDIEDYGGGNEETNYWKLAQEMPVLGSDSIVVFSKGLVRGVKGKRPTISEHINWMVLDDGEAQSKYVGAWVVNDSVELLQVNSDHRLTDIAKRNISKADEEIKRLDNDSLFFSSEKGHFNIPVWKKDTIGAGIFFDTDFEKEKYFMEAALKAVGAYGGYPVNIVSYRKGESVRVFDSVMDLSVWLGVDPHLETPVTIIFNPDSLAGKLLVPTERKNLYSLTQRLNIESAIDMGLTKDLAHILLKNDSIQNLVDSYDLRVLAEEEIVPVFEDINRSSVRMGTMDVSPWLWSFIALLLLFERMLSKMKKQ